MAAILKSAQKGGGRPNLYGVNISIIDQWGPLNKMIPLMEDPGGVHGDPSGPMDYRSLQNRS